MQFPEEQIDGGVIFRPKGRIDGNELIQTEARVDELIESGQKRLMIDMSGADFINSAGLRMLLIIGKRLQGAGGTLSLFALQENVARVFEIARFNNIFPIYNNQSEAMK